MRRVLPAGTLGPTLLVEDESGVARLVAKLITTAPEEDLEPLAAALRTSAASEPTHPGLVPIHDVGVDAGGVYVVASWVDAPALDTRLRGGRQPLVQVLEWLAPVAGGLQAAHDQGCLHGAVHPRDVLLPRGRGTLTGLGISPALERLGLQAPVRVPFTAPERASGRAWDARADQYSLAMLALDALSGRRLIAGTIPAFDRWTLADTPGEDARLHEVFARALHPDPDRRFPTLAAWLEAMTGAAEPGTDLSRFTRDGVIPPPQAPTRRTRDADVADQELPLALFPAEDPQPDDDRPAAASNARKTGPGPDGETITGAVQSPTGEWLVASMPEDAPPLADTGPLPIQSLDEVRQPPPPAIIVPPAPVAASSALSDLDADDDFALNEPAGTDDDQDADASFSSPHDETTSDWTSDPATEETSSSSRTAIVLAAALVLFVLVAFGTWRSLVRDDTAAPTGSSVGTQETEPPTEVAETPLEPSADDTTPAPEAPPVASTAVEVPPVALPSTDSEPLAPAPAPAAPAPGQVAPAAPAEEAPLLLDRARLLIRSSPSGQVRINGQPRGQTPLVLRDLPFGSYVIAISRPGFVSAVREVDMLPSQPVASVSVDLERATGSAASAAPPPQTQSPAPSAPAPRTPPAAPTGSGSLYVVSRPPDARLFIDGQDYGTAPAVVPGLSAGRHQIRVTYPGYRAWDASVDVQPGQRVRVEASLVQEPR